MRKILSFFIAILFAGSMMATLPENPQWEAKALADIADGSTLIIISNSTTATNVALPSTATTSNPAKKICEVTTAGGVTTITAPEGSSLQDLAWTLVKSGDNYKFYQEGSEEIRMYLTGLSTNTGLRIGNANSVNDEFVMGDLGQLLKVTTGTRFVGPYDNNGSDWRTYNTENATNYKGAALTFYVLKASQGGEGGETPAHTYTVAGSSDVAFGTTWAPTNTANDMTLVDGLYKWEKTGLTLPSGELKFKVCEDHDWAVSYPAQDYVLNIAESGVYTLTITYNPEGNVVNGVAQKTGDAVVIPTVAMHGNFGGSNWADTENFAVAEGNETASLTLNLAAGDYEFGMRIGGSGNWTANGAAFTRENNAAVIEAGQGNITLDADAAGEYTFTWTYATNTLTITYPEYVAPTYTYADGYYLIGLDMQDWNMEYMPTEGRLFAANPDNEGEYQLTIALAADQQFKVVSVQKDQIKSWYPDGMDNNYIVDAAHAGEKTVYFRPDGQGGEGWHYGCIYVAANEDQPTPVADFTQPFTLKFNGTGESGKDASAAFAADVAAIFDAASAPYVASVETATKTFAGRPIADDNSSVKFGTTSVQGSLSFTLAQAIEVDSIIVNATQYGNNAAKITVNGTEFDLTAGNKVPQDCKITPTGAVSAITIAQSGSERIYLRNVRVYPKTAAPEPTAKFYVTGNAALVGQDKEWNPAAIKSMNDTLVLNLEAGIDYVLKVAVNGTWEGENNVKGFNELTEKTEGLLDISDDHNIGFRLAEAGEVKVVYIAAAEEQPEVFKLIGNFYVAPAPDPTVAVMGSMNNWAAEIPFTLSDDKTYATLTVENITAGDYEFKFVVNGEWRSNGYTYHRGFPACAGITENNDQNMVFQADVTGQYTFYWYFANDSAAILYPELPFACDWENIEFLGDGSPEQTHANQYKLCKEGEYPGVVNVQKPGFADESGIYVTFPSAAFGEISLQEGTYAIQGAGMILYCSAFDAQQETEVTVVCDNNPIVFTVYNAAAAVVPDPTVAVMGSMNDWAEEIPFVLSDDKTYASLTVNNIGADEYAFKFIINGEWRSNGYRYHRGFPGAAGITENNEANMVFVADQDGEYTFTWFFSNDSLAITYPEYIEPVYNLENGYYLVGNFGGVDAWSVEDLSAEKKFAANPDNEGEYQLAVNFAENDQVKVAYVENDQIIFWYPKGDNYTVDHNHAGPTSMYFRPDYFDDWNVFGGYFYIVPTDHVGVDNVDAAQQAVKMLREGQIMIIRGEHIYTPMGQMIK